jgi:voltage-gated potassium channel
MIRLLRERKYLVLLVFIVMLETLQPFADKEARRFLFYDLFVALLMVGVLLSVFEQRWQQFIGITLAAFGMLSGWLHYFLPEAQLHRLGILHNLCMFVFCAVAVLSILGNIFRQQMIRGDDVLGAICGYLLAGIAFANLYLLVAAVHSGAFDVSARIAGELASWHSRRFFFSYFSFVTLTSMGYGDITATHPMSASLTWMEAIFGQFYVAVVVAQMVGMRLTSATLREKVPASPPMGNE